MLYPSNVAKAFCCGPVTFQNLVAEGIYFALHRDPVSGSLETEVQTSDARKERRNGRRWAAHYDVSTR